jgi:hypothetical protein
MRSVMRKLQSAGKMDKKLVTFNAEVDRVNRFDVVARAWGTNRTALLNMLMEEAIRLHADGAFLFRLSAQDTTQTEQHEESDRT